MLIEAGAGTLNTVRVNFERIDGTKTLKGKSP